MFGLIYKEFVSNKKIIKGVAVCLCFILFMFTCVAAGYGADRSISGSNEIDISEILVTILMPCIFIYCLIGIVQQQVIKTDEKRLWAYYITSTPDGVKQQIGSKYLFVLLTAYIAFELCNLYDLVVSLINDVPAQMYMSLYMIAMQIMIFINAVEIPFVIRFGSKAGNNYRVILFVIVLFAILVYGLFGDITSFIESDMNILEIIADLLTGNTENQSSMMKLSLVISLFPYITGVLFFLSYKLSCKLYLKGTECYNE